MAVWVHRDIDGELKSELIPAEFLDGHLESGWSVVKPGSETTDIEVDLSSEEVREAAKEAGLEGWETKRIGTLKAELDAKE